MEQATEIFDAVLPDADARVARALAWRAATLDFDHPYRAATMSELGSYEAPADELEGVRQHVDAATACMTQARTSLVAALERAPSPGAIVQLLVLLEHGGRWNDVVDLGVAAAAHEEVQRDIQGLYSLVAALDALDRPEFASSILNAANAAVVLLPRDLLAMWCRLLFEAEEWRRLEGIGTTSIVASKAIPGPEGRDLKATAELFRGFAYLNLGQYPEARDDFRAYISEPARAKPIPHALGFAYYGLAQTWAAEGAGFEAHQNLKNAIGAAPEIDAEVWVAFAEAQVAQKYSATTAADSLFKAVDLAQPSERPKLIARWEELSQLAMKERERTLDDSEERAREKQTYVLRNDEKAPTWEFYALGNRYVEAGDWRGALAAGRAIVGRHSDHVLGLDLLIEANAMIPSWPKTTELLLRRAELHGPYPATHRIAREIPPGVISPEDFVRLMELDPRSTGLLRVVEALRAEGRTELAIEALSSIRPEQRSAEASLVLARLYADTGLLTQAIQAANAISTGSPQHAAAIELAFEAALDMRKPGVLDRLVPDLLAGAAEADLEPEAAERAALWLFAHDHVPGARALLAALDHPQSRTGARLSALGLTHVAAGRTTEAENVLDRAEPFARGPEQEIARLVLLGRTERWVETPAEVARLRTLDYTPSSWADAALSALSEHVREAAAAAAQALAIPGAAPEHHLVLGAANALLPEEDRVAGPDELYAEETARFLAACGEDPRHTLVLLCALETPSGAAWAHQRILTTAIRGGRMWPAWLMARACDRLGHPDRATQNVEALVRNMPTFRQGWDRLEADLVRAEGTRLAPSYTAFVERRLSALGPQPGDDPLSAAIVRVQKHVRTGDMLKALEFLEKIRPSLESSPVGLISYARVLRLAGLRAEAVQSFSAALDAVPAAEAERVVDEFLALGTQAYLERALSPQAWRAYLAALRAQLPDSPTVALAWARFERQTARDPAEGWALAVAEYERFREATGGVALDELQPGSAARWADFFLSESPEEAERMIRAELPKSPGSPDLWRLLGQALEEQGRIDEAFDRYVAVSNMLPDPATMRRAAEILAQRGSDHRLLELTLERIAAVERPTGPDPSLELLRARSLAHSGSEGVALSIPLFEQLWARRHLLRGPRARVDLAESYGVALLQRGRPADAPRIREVLGEALPRVTDPLRRDMLQSYLHLCGWMPEPPPPPPSPEQAARAAEGSSS
jgi:tetratricopeptide (TPR) repeat protein